MITFGNIYDVSQALVWLTGSVYGRSWANSWPLLPWLLLFMLLALVLARDLDALALGDNLAQGLGNWVEWTRSLLLICTAALAGSAIATAGTIGFVGLIAPPLARQLGSPSQVGLIPVAALTGGCLVKLADLAGRLLFAPV